MPSPFLKVNVTVAAYAPMLGLVLMIWAVLELVSEGDWRFNASPWLLGAALICLAVCGLGLLKVHQPAPRRSVVIGVGLTVLAFLGLSSFPFAVGISGLFGIEEDSVGVLAYLPLIGAGLGFVAMTPALAVAGVGIRASRVLPDWGVWALWVETPLLLVTIIGGGMAPESLKEIFLVSGFILIPLGWVVIGASLLRTKTLQHART
jgi:hypothetical protein